MNVLCLLQAAGGSPVEKNVYFTEAPDETHTIEQPGKLLTDAEQSCVGFVSNISTYQHYYVMKYHCPCVTVMCLFYCVISGW